MNEKTRDCLDTVSTEERDQFYTDSKCVPTPCDRAIGLPRVRWLHQQNNMKPFHRVVDLGCHDGFSTRWLLNSPHLEQLVGVDLCEEAIHHAKRLKEEKIFPELSHYHCESIFENSLVHGFFDVVVCFELIEHMVPEDSRKLIRVCHELLVPGGRAFMSTPHIDGHFGESNPDPAHIHFFTEETLAEWVKEETGASATVVDIQGILHCLWTKENPDGEKTTKDAESSSEPSQGSEDPEGWGDQREAADSSPEALLQPPGGGSEADQGSEEKTLEERLCALEANSHAPVITYAAKDLDAIHLSFAQRLEALERKAQTR